MIVIWTNGLSSSWKEVLFIDISDLKDVTPEGVSSLLNHTRNHRNGYVIGTSDNIKFHKRRAAKLVDHINKWGINVVMRKLHRRARGSIRDMLQHHSLLAQMIKRYHLDMSPVEKDFAESSAESISLFTAVFKYSPLERP